MPTVKTAPAKSAAEVLSRPATSGAVIALPAADAAPALKSQESDSIVTRNGKLRRVKAVIRLSAAKKEIYTIDKGATFQIQAEGFRSLNSSIGAEFVLAPTVPVDGVDQRNPHVVRNERGKIVECFVRGALIGRAFNGNVVKVYQTIHLNPDAYFRRDLFQAIRLKERWEKGDDGRNRKVDVVREWGDVGRLVALEALDRARLADYEAVYEIDDVVAIVVDLRAPAVQDVIATRHEKEIFAVRLAQTILERRLYSAHPGFPRATIPGEYVQQSWTDGNWPKLVNAIADITVLGWVEDDDARRDIETVVASTAQGAKDDRTVVVHEAAPATAWSEETADKVGPVDDAAVTAEAAAPSAAAAPEYDHAKSVRECEDALTRLRGLPNGKARATEIFRELTDPALSLADHRPAQIAVLKREVDAALAELSAAPKAEAKPAPRPTATPKAKPAPKSAPKSAPSPATDDERPADDDIPF